MFQANPDDNGWEDEAICYGELCSREEAREGLDKLLLKRLGGGLLDPVNHLSGGRKRDGVLKERSSVMGPHDIYHGPARFLRMLHQKKHSRLHLKEQRQEGTKGRLSDSISRKWLCRATW